MDINLFQEVFISKDSKHRRKLAITRLLKGESPSSICTSRGRSRFRRYK